MYIYSVVKTIFFFTKCEIIISVAFLEIAYAKLRAFLKGLKFVSLKIIPN